jgi:hypothetical protein
MKHQFAGTLASVPVTQSLRSLATQRNFTLDDDSYETLLETIAACLVTAGHFSTRGEARQAMHEADDYDRIRDRVNSNILNLAKTIAAECAIKV